MAVPPTSSRRLWWESICGLCRPRANLRGCYHAQDCASRFLGCNCFDAKPNMTQASKLI